jgi:hypothetical protein
LASRRHRGDFDPAPEKEPNAKEDSARLGQLPAIGEAERSSQSASVQEADFAARFPALTPLANANSATMPPRAVSSNLCRRFTLRPPPQMMSFIGSC